MHSMTRRRHAGALQQRPALGLRGCRQPWAALVRTWLASPRSVCARRRLLVGKPPPNPTVQPPSASRRKPTRAPSGKTPRKAQWALGLEKLALILAARTREPSAMPSRTTHTQRPQQPAHPPTNKAPPSAAVAWPGAANPRTPQGPQGTVCNQARLEKWRRRSFPLRKPEWGSSALRRSMESNPAFFSGMRVSGSMRLTALASARLDAVDSA